LVKNPHVGGFQEPLFLPPSNWKRPRELPDLRQASRVALDTEGRDDGLSASKGPGWATGQGYIGGYSVAWDEDGGYEGMYFPTRDPDTDNFEPENVARWVKDHQRAGVEFLFQNSNFDIGWMTNEGIEAKSWTKIQDTMNAAVMIDETQFTYNLDALCKRRGIPGKDEQSLLEVGAAFGFHTRKAIKQNLWRFPARYKATYAAQDAVAVLQLWDAQRSDLDEQELWGAYRLEMDLVPLVVRMRQHGIRVNIERAYEEKDYCLAHRDRTFKTLRDKLGEKVGMEEIGKNKWLERIFAAHAPHIPIPRTPPSKAHPEGQPSFTAGSTGWMPKWREADGSPHWLPQLIVQADKYHNAATKFIQGYIIDFAHRGRLHASINQLLGEDEDGAIKGTRTLRFSYSEPPLQQMTARDEDLAPRIRGLFEAELRRTWASIDYSQQEYRQIVHFAEVLELTKASIAAQKYRDDPKTDYHSMVAEMTGLERKPAKDTNFAKSYGAGKGKFASMINKSIEEASAIMDQYDREMPFVRELSELCQSLASERGYIRMLDGARSHFNDWELAWRPRGMPALSYSLEKAREIWPGKKLKRAFTKDAMNRLIQGSSARQTKEAMRAIDREGYLPLLQMHDELDFSLEHEEDGRRIAEIMRDVRKLNVPMLVDVEYGPTWGTASKVEGKDKKVLYKATWAEAQRLAAEGPWWREAA
jgi:DNA polymerase I-like protein with 3'-5' exonuclease and polymerase domains